MNQTGYGVYHGCLESKTEGIFAIACVGKKSYYFIRKFAIISKRLRLLNFKNRPLLSGQEIIQIEQNSVWSIPCAFRVKNECGLFHRVKELFKSNQSWYGVSYGNLKCETKRVFCIACLEKKLVFHTEIEINGFEQQPLFEIKKVYVKKQWNRIQVRLVMEKFKKEVKSAKNYKHWTLNYRNSKVVWNIPILFCVIFSHFNLVFAFLTYCSN